MRPFALAVVLAVVAGCSAPSSVDLCHGYCDFLQRCPGALKPLSGSCQALPAASCSACCDDMQGTLLDTDTRDDANCRNSGDVRSGVMSCLQGSCTGLPACIGQLDNTCLHFQ